MRDLLERILESLFQANNRNSPEAKAQYLQSLRPAAQQLWRAYQQQAGIARDARYSEAVTQAVYMLRYFPPYTQLIHECLSAPQAGGLVSLNVEPVRAVYFGAGPAPEVYGTLQFLLKGAPTVRRFVAEIFDIFDAAWAPSRATTFNRLVPLLWHNREINIRTHSFDIATQPIGDPESRLALTEARLVVFQNCLNEIPADRHSFVTENLIRILQLMPAGSLLLVIERTGYPAMAANLTALGTIANDRRLCDAVFSGQNLYGARHIKDSMPAIVMQNLFLRQSRVYGFIEADEAGLILSSSIPYTWFSFRRV